MIHVNSFIKVLYISIIFVYSVVCYATPFKVGVASSMTKVKRDMSGLQQISYDKSVSVDMAKDECESFQLVLIPQGANLNNLSITYTGGNLSNNNILIKFYYSGYSKVPQTSYSPNKENWIPDPLFEFTTLSVGSAYLQPVWVSIQTSPLTPAGTYSSNIEMLCGSDVQTIPISIKVRNFVIPRPGTLATSFGCYRNVLDQWYHGEKWKFTKANYDKWSYFMAKYRLTPKEVATDYVNAKTTIIDSLTGETQVTSVDMSYLRSSLPDLTKNYLAENSYHFYRLPSGLTLKKELENPNSWWHKTDSLIAPIWKRIAEWRKEGFTDKTYIYGVDEPNSALEINGTADIYRAIKKVDPNMKIMQTGRCNKNEFIGLVDIWCPLSDVSWLPFFQDRLKEGSVLWQYVCVVPKSPYANFFVDEPGINHRSLFWQTRKVGATGFLYWASTWVNNYTPQAYQGVTCFPDIPWDYDIAENKQGDGMIIYPGKAFTPIPTIRLEIIRDGIEDYEYFSILKKLTENEMIFSKNPDAVNKAKKLLLIPDSIVTNNKIYTQNEQYILDYRIKLADAIEELTEIHIEPDYYINNAADLYALANNVNNNGMDFMGKNFKLTADIDLNGANWDPIGGGCSMQELGKIVFRGSIDGSGYTISNFNINMPTSFGVGFIGYMDTGNICNLKIKGATIKGYNYVGGLVGCFKSSSILSCESNVAINGNTFVGGLIGGMFGSIVSGCSVSGTVKGISTVGGIVGQSFPMH